MTSSSSTETSDKQIPPQDEVQCSNDCSTVEMTTTSEPTEEETDGMKNQSMTLNVAYESLELVRKVNLQVEFGERVDVNQCIPCLREKCKSATSRRSWRVKEMWTRNKAIPCLTCGSTVCPRHRSKEFCKENITICCECSHLFSLEYMVKSVMIAEGPNDQHKKKMNYMLEVYDRALLMLKYSTQYIGDIADELKKNTVRNNKIGLGSSATGVVSGIAGVAAAVTIFTPVGPPLLIASILFGGSATAAAASSEAVNYRCEPNRMADRIMALHAIVHSISNLPSAIDMDYEAVTAAPVEAASTNSLHWTRATMNGLKPLTAGALSAISIVTEAKQMSMAVQKIRAGNPCEKAKSLNTIEEESSFFPETNALAEQLAIVRKRLSKRAS